MKLIYFAKVSDGLYTLSWVGVILFCCLLVIAFISFMADMSEYNDGKERAVRWIRNYIIGLFTCGLFTVIFPTKQEFYEIYGVGKTIEYLESNEQAKQLPDKAINALDAWLDNFCKSQESNKSDK